MDTMCEEDVWELRKSLLLDREDGLPLRGNHPIGSGVLNAFLKETRLGPGGGPGTTAADHRPSAAVYGRTSRGTADNNKMAGTSHRLRTTSNMSLLAERKQSVISFHNLTYKVGIKARGCCCRAKQKKLILDDVR